MSKHLKFRSVLVISALTMISTVLPANAAANITYMEPVANGVTLDPFATAGGQWYVMKIDDWSSIY